MVDKQKFKKVTLISLGCPKNLVDSEVMLGLLAQKGYQICRYPDESEITIINTCGFIKDAKNEALEVIFDVIDLKKKGIVKKILVGGCLFQRYRQELIAELQDDVDAFFGVGDFPKIIEIVEKTENSKIQPLIKETSNYTYLLDNKVNRVNTLLYNSIYIKISEGCNKRCAFCVIPSIKGNLKSREVSDIVLETKKWVKKGIREIILIAHDFFDYGQDLINAGKESNNIYNLLEELDNINGLSWIRIMYMNPEGINMHFLNMIKKSSKILPYFDIPFQHINENILKKMNRKLFHKEKIIELVENIYNFVPEAVIRTQFIVGFPGEEEKEFNELLDFVAKYKFDHLGCFSYSREEGTASFHYPDQIDEKIKLYRYNALMQLQKKISKAKLKKYLGKTIPVLIEGYSEETDLLLQGRSKFQAPDIDGLVLINKGKANIGDLVSVKIKKSTDYDLIGQITNNI